MGPSEKSEYKNGKKTVDEILKKVKNTKWLYVAKNKRIKILIFRSILLIIFAIGIVCGIKTYQQYLQNLRIWDGTTIVDHGWKSFDGDGTEDDPYQIKTATQLAWLGYISQYESFGGKYFELEEDIILNKYNIKKVLNGIQQYAVLYDDTELQDDTGELQLADLYGYNGIVVPDSDNINQWIPIGNQDYPFEGNFNGNHHTIYGLYISTENDYQGLFGKCSADSSVENVNVVAVTIKSSGSYVGAIAGQSEGLINECTVYSAICTGRSYVGRISGSAHVISNSFAFSRIGENYNDNKIDSSKFKCYGGISGTCDYLINSSGSVEFTYVDNSRIVGGLIGELKYDAYNCILLGACLETV